MSTITPDELIKTLISQHRTLQLDLTEARALAVNRVENADKIVQQLQTFKSHVVEHLTLEDNTFYTQYIALKEKRGEDVKPTYEFMKQMKGIGKAVMDFLNDNSSMEKIAQSEHFPTQLLAIKKTLDVRIETEEEGVYDIFLIMAHSSL